jgi:hypothetical protein
VARYCSAECQKSHWKYHKVGCAIDADTGIIPPKKERRLFVNFNDNCRHGGPSPPFEGLSECFGLVEEIASIQEEPIGTEGTSDRQLYILEDFAHKKTRAINPNTIKLLVSTACDAFVDNNSSTSRMFLRAVFFFEAFLACENFISLLHDADATPDSHPAFAAFLDALKRTMPRSGLIEELQRRTSGACRCMLY